MKNKKEIDRKKSEIEESGDMIKNKWAKTGEQKVIKLFFKKKSPLYLSVCL